jgi:hypothetical protein
LPEELARVDALLDDPVFFAPFTPFFDPRIGRPSTPMETYLRLMFLKLRTPGRPSAKSPYTPTAARTDRSDHGRLFQVTRKMLTGLRPSPTRHVMVGLGSRAPVER